MSSFTARNSIRAFAPVATASLLSFIIPHQRSTSCDNDQAAASNQAHVHNSSPTNKDTPLAAPPTKRKAGMFGGGDEQVYFHDLIPKRQLWRPSEEYPMWDDNWDGKLVKKELEHLIRREGVTRHIILIRHGQYDETHKEDEKKILTKMGREQAELTGRRLAEIVKGIDEKFGPCNVKVLRVSDMTRAKETADIIAKYLPDIKKDNPDPLLNEGRPSHHIPCGGKVRSSIIENVDKNHPRIEQAFRKYFFRASYDPKKTEEEDDSKKSEEENPQEQDKLSINPKHEFEIIVCHANVIRYFFCRALQLPPEAWLRLCTFNCSLTYLTIRPTGTVSCRMLGDIGHLGYDHSTFSMHYGFNW